MFTRKQRLADECTHEQYFLEIADEAGLIADNKQLVARCALALAGGDKHLNTIPLPLWDGMRAPISLHKAMKVRGDYLTLSGIVCTWKALYKRAALAD